MASSWIDTTKADLEAECERLGCNPQQGTHQMDACRLGQIMRATEERYMTRKRKLDVAKDLVTSCSFTGVEEARHIALFTLDGPVWLYLDELFCYQAVRGLSFDDLKIEIKDPDLHEELQALWVARLGDTEKEMRAKHVVNLGDRYESIFDAHSPFGSDNDASDEDMPDAPPPPPEPVGASIDDPVDLGSSSDDHADNDDDDTSKFDQTDWKSAFEAADDADCAVAEPKTQSVSKRINANRLDEPGVWLPEGLWAMLKRHQRAGVRFLWRCIVQDKSGALLLHDMGLGKTVQTIALLTALRSAASTSSTRALLPPALTRLRVLVLCPGALAENWESEFKKFLPRVGRHADQLTYLGRIIVPGHEKDLDARHMLIQQWASGAGVLVMGHELYRNTMTEPRQRKVHAPLRDAATIVIVDEIHKAKGGQTNIRDSINKIRTDFRIGLTGTPLSNDVTDVYSLVSWARKDQHGLGTTQFFKQQFVSPIQAGIRPGASPQEKDIAMQCLDALQEIIKPSIDRQRQDVLKLPRIRKIEVIVPMTQEQLDSYQAYIASQQIADRGNFIWQSNHDLGLLLVHPKLFRRIVQKEEDTLPERSGDSTPQVKSHISRKHSHKWHVLTAILDSCRMLKDNVIVFTQRPDVARFVEEYVRSGGWDAFLVDGAVTDKKKVVDAFTTCCAKGKWAVMCASTKAAGVGFNMQAANRVIFTDIGYSPNAEEQQAVCRAARMGQKKSVWVYSLAVAHSVDEPIGQISTYKKDLFDLVVDNGQQRRFHAEARDPTAADRQPRISEIPEPGQLRMPVGSEKDLVLTHLASLQSQGKIGIHSIRDYDDPMAGADGSSSAGAAGSGGGEPDVDVKVAPAVLDAQDNGSCIVIDDD